MKTKPFKTGLSALSLALLPLMASSHAHAATAEIFDDSVIVVYKENVSKAEKMRARSSVGARISDANRDEIDDRFSNLLNGRIAKLQLRGKSVKYFKIKLGDTIFNGSMWDYVDVILKFEGIAMLLFL